jgi:hypothetical protein
MLADEKTLLVFFAEKKSTFLVGSRSFVFTTFSKGFAKIVNLRKEKKNSFKRQTKSSFSS